MPPKATAKNPLWPLFLLVALAVGITFFWQDQLGFETLRRYHADLSALRDAHFVISLIVFWLAYVTVIALSLPGAALASLLGGYLFGLALGTAANVTAATTGAVLVFLAARYGLAGRFTLNAETASGPVRRIMAGLQENEISVLFLMRLVPVVPFFMANLIAAGMGVGLVRFVVTTFLGIIPGAIVYTWVGSGLGAVLVRGETPDLGVIWEPQVIGPILALCALAGLPMIVRTWRRKRTDATHKG